MLMKKFLLPMLLSLAVVAANAQQKPEKASFDPQAKMAKATMLQKAGMDKPAEGIKQGRKAKSNGVYYTKPACTMWAGESVEGSFYYRSYLLLPPYQELVFNNKATNKANSTWTWREEAQEAEANGDYNFGSTGCYQTNGYNLYGDAPVLAVGNTQFSLGDLNINWATSGSYADTYKDDPSKFGVYMMKDSLADMTFIDSPHALSGGAWGICHPDESTYYLFGNGNFIDGEGQSYVVAGASQIYPRPYNLYLTSAHTLALTMTQPLTGDAMLTMTFYNVVEKDGEDAIGDRVLGQFFAKATNCVKLGGPYNTNYTKTGTYYYYSVEFKNEYQDDFGSWVEQPVVLNEKFAMVITGFDQAGVDVNFMGSIPQDEEDFEGQSSVLVWADADKTGLAPVQYQSQIIIDMNFTGLFDYTEVLTTGVSGEEQINNLNVLKVSADGKTVTNMYEGLEDVVQIYTAYPWLDDQGIGNYFYELPDWISTLDYVEVEPQVSNGVEYRRGYGYATVACDPLPSGVTGRSCVIYIEGRGMRSETPIVVLQGDAKLEDVVYDGIDEVSRDKSNTTSGYYNLNGQKLNGKALKGLIIKDGKKFIVK